MNIQRLAMVIWCCAMAGGFAPEARAGNANKCWTNYKAALLDRNGDQAARLVTRSTLQYYANAADKALNLGVTDTHELPLMQKLLVLTFRSRVPKSFLEDDNEASLFSYFVTTQLVNLGTIARADVSAPPQIGGEVLASLTLDNAATNLTLRFVSEGGALRIDLVHLLAQLETQLSEALATGHVNVDEFAEKAAIGTQPSLVESVWLPLNQTVSPKDAKRTH